MKNTLLVSLFMAFFVCAATAQTGPLHLRYEWSPDTSGPWTALPPEMLKVHEDGSATVVPSGSKGFFRLLIKGGTAGGGGGLTPVLPISSVPQDLQEALQRFMSGIAADTAGGGGVWENATLSPFVIPMFSPWNDSEKPDLVEIKILGPCDANRTDGIFAQDEGGRSSRERGFILASLSRESPPIVGYQTGGDTPAEELLAQCGGRPVAVLRRFGPMFLGAEDESGELIANEGLLPVMLEDSGYADHTRPMSLHWDSSNANNPRFPEAPPPARPMEFSSYRQLRTAYQASRWLAGRRSQRAPLMEFEWLAMEGRAPSLSVRVGEQLAFLPDRRFVSYRLEDEDSTQGAVIVLPASGVSITGKTPGALRLTLVENDGTQSRFFVVVRPGLQARDGASGIFTERKSWAAGPHPADSSLAWEQQPFYSQRSDLDRWCPAVGCGPVMIALLIGWAEQVDKVESAFWNRDAGASLAVRRLSLRNIDAPKNYFNENHNSLAMLGWYDYLHGQCNVACWPHNGNGSALPHDVGSTLYQYFNQVTSVNLPLSVGAAGIPLVGGTAHHETDIISDDWDESGILVANGIKAGHPGGVLYYEHMHYCLAWKYTRITTKVKVNGVTLQSWNQRFFTVNAGWGKAQRVWNAYDIDGCFLMNLRQDRELPP